MRAKNEKAKKAFMVLGTAILTIVLIGTFAGLDKAYSKTSKEIDSSVDVALDRFYKQVKGAKEFVKTAKALLVMPGVTKAAVGVGGEYGEGALRIQGKSADYYSFMAASFGLQIGAQAKDMVIAFMTDEALQKFRASKGWEAGVDGNIALIKIGAGTTLDTKNIQDPIVAFVFDTKGLMADVSLKGGKFSKLDKSK